MNKVPTVEEQLMLLKATTIRTGAIHEAQKLQMQLWPRMSNQIAPGVVAKVDPEKKIVILECKSKKKPYNHAEFEAKLFNEIVGWVRRIVWDETKVVIKVNGKRLLDSSNQ